VLNDKTTGCCGRGGIVCLELSGMASTNRIRVLLYTIKNCVSNILMKLSLQRRAAVPP
jgi:hypothetical protein